MHHNFTNDSSLSCLQKPGKQLPRPKFENIVNENEAVGQPPVVF